MARKVYLNVTVQLIVNLEDGEDVRSVIDDMEMDFEYRPDNAENRIIEAEILSHEVTDSK
jgi:hypothetical protein